MKEPGKTFADLVVWQKSHRPVFAVYRLTQAFPHSDTGCPSQLRRGATHRGPQVIGSLFAVYSEF
jgi:hypothetical protein